MAKSYKVTYQQSSSQVYGSASVTADFSQILQLARDLEGNGQIPKRLTAATNKAVDRSAKNILRRLKANVNLNDSHISKFGTLVQTGLYYHPYSRSRPMLGTLGHDPRLVHRLTRNMNSTASIDGPVKTPNGNIFSEIGWDSARDGRYIKYVVEGTRYMIPRDVLGLTIEQMEDKCLQIFLDELNMDMIFGVSGGVASFGGLSSPLSGLLSGGFP